MNFTFVKNYIAKCHAMLRLVSQHEKLPMLWLWADSVWAMLRYGCTITQYAQGEFYRLRGFERRRIVTFRRFRKLQQLNAPASIPYLRDKDKFNAHFAPFVHREWIKTSYMTFDNFVAFCQRHSRIVLKPLDGMEGKGVRMILPPPPSNPAAVNQLFAELKRENLLLEEAVCQHPQMIFGNQSVNTIRVMTVMDKHSGEVTLFRANLRAGVGSAQVDNFHEGGCAYQVDTVSGRVVSFGCRRSTGDGRVLIHPGTDICMLGYQIPNWEKVVSGCKAAHILLPQCRLIAWDVAITPEGIELIEGNHDGDYDMLEFFGDRGYWSLLRNFL